MIQNVKAENTMFEHHAFIRNELSLTAVADAD